MLEKYYKPKSLTWWTGMATIVYGVITKNVESIFVGLGAIGVRGAITEGDN